MFHITRWATEDMIRLSLVKESLAHGKPAKVKRSEVKDVVQMAPPTLIWAQLRAELATVSA